MAAPSLQAATAGALARRPRYEVAEVVRRYGSGFLGRQRTTPAQRQVLRAIARCRTAALGGHVEQCERCAHQRVAYNSCRNRHCPKCQGRERAQWAATEQARLLPVEYFHVVFTLPHALTPLIRANRRLLYGLLLRTAAATLMAFAQRHWGGEPALTVVLHTWGQTLVEHVHVHCVISGGGLSPDGRRWCAPRRRGGRPFLFPVRALSRVFRGKYLAGLQRARHHARLCFAGQSASLAAPTAWQALRTALRRSDWVVYAKRPFGGPTPVLRYLSRYTHRIAISNHRLTFVGNHIVRFRYTDYAAQRARKELTLSATEFLRRFLLHVLPPHFMRIRHYGMVANRNRHKLDRCRTLLGVPPPRSARPITPTTRPATTVTTLSDRPSPRCPLCGGRLQRLALLVPAPHDSS
jgi:hypothetical protein